MRNHGTLRTLCADVLGFLVLTAWVSTAAGTQPTSPATAGPPIRHPNLLFNRQELAELKAKIDKYPWARQTFERIKADAEADGSHQYRIPTRVATAMMYALTGDPKYAQAARQHVVERLKDLQAKDCPWQWSRGVQEAIMYDLVYDTFSDQERRDIEKAFRRIGRLELELAESG